MSDFFDFLNDEGEKNEISSYETDSEKAEYLQLILTNHATSDGPADFEHYKILRRYFLDKPDTKELLPAWVRTKRDLGQFWQFIKSKFSTYAERRTFIWNEFSPLLDYLESDDKTPHAEDIGEQLGKLNSEYVTKIWQKAILRKKGDPEGAITLSRTLVETTLKHILDSLNVKYSDKAELHELYKGVANELKLAPEQHTEKSFKQILGGCSSIISGLGTMRNSIGDAHGKGKKYYSPSPRHAELAVNLSGAMCLYLLHTLEENDR